MKSALWWPWGLPDTFNPILFGLTEAQVLGIVSMLAGTALIVREALHGTPVPAAGRESR